MSNVAVFDQCAGAGVSAESPLSHVSGKKGGTNPGVILREKAFLGYLTLRGNAADQAFGDAVQQVLGMTLPTEPMALHLSADKSSSIQWIAPDEWLILLPGGGEYETEQAFRAAYSGHFALVNISGGQTLLTLTGPAARDVLHKSTGYDVHPRNFPVGKGVTTTFAKATAVIRRPSEDVWELVVRRSFADYCYRWLVDASREFGLDAEI
ncbi:sarcosine oxidase subunit gamma [Nitrincola iocasae]|uniref:Sarcosine oxidase subunit gamma family protein n=1 Tax=Nitrincola iocasae TaxID=2614693 RepID=A0A5J6LFS6_9GAMM|nr:sarcosine oxidase subunit gamma family protein [Nitrincola iocasae]QEW07206.1 sarcosine oxidase subunit gamma family protein [Nitrincola iocasae]